MNTSDFINNAEYLIRQCLNQTQIDPLMKAWLQDACLDLAKARQKDIQKTNYNSFDDCDQIVVNELKDAYQRNNHFDKVDCSDDVLEPDYELLKAIQTVLEFYMPRDIWSEWMEMNPMVKEERV